MKSEWTAKIIIALLVIIQGFVVFLYNDLRADVKDNTAGRADVLVMVGDVNVTLAKLQVTDSAIVKTLDEIKETLRNMR